MQDNEGEDMQPMGMHILSKKLVIYTSFKKIAFNETLDAEGEDMQPMGAHILSKKLLAPRLRVKWVNLGRFWGKQKKIKGPLMSIYLFKYRNLKVQLLRQHWVHFVRDHSACSMQQMRQCKSPC